MADQVSPLGSIATGHFQTLPVGLKSSPAPGKAIPAKSADPNAQGRPEFVSAQNLDDAVNAIKGYLQNTQTDLHFSVDKATGDFVFKIVNSVTQEVIRQVPTEEALTLAQKLRALSGSQDASGVLMDKKG